MDDFSEFWTLYGKKIKKYTSIAGVIIICLLLNPCYIVEAGHKGVVLNCGAVSDSIKDEGITYKIPFAQSIKEIEVRMRKIETETEAPSKDLQEIKTIMIVNYHLAPDSVNKLYKEVGGDFTTKIITPAIYETMKMVMAQFTASDLIAKRDSVSTLIREDLKVKLLKYYILVDEVNMKDFQFSKTFSESIELKQKAEQDALKAKNVLEQVKTEAQQKIETAKAEAESIRLRQQQLTPMMINMRLIEAWEKGGSQVPSVIGGNGIFNLKDIIKGSAKSE